MRKLFTTVGLVLAALMGLPMPASATTASAACPLEGGIVVELTQTRLLGWNQEQNQLGPFPAAIPAGTYDVTLASHDDHSTKPDQDHTQPAEIWYLTASAAGSAIAQSAPTPDLPDGQDLLVSPVGQLELSAAVDSLMAYHGHFDAYNPNSVTPLCARFVPAETAAAVPAPIPVPDAAPVTPASVADPDPTLTSELGIVADPLEVNVPPVASASVADPDPTLTSELGIVADPLEVNVPAVAPAAPEAERPTGVMPAVVSVDVDVDADAAPVSVQPQLAQLPFTGFHPGFAATGLLAMALGLGLLRIGHDAPQRVN